MNLNKDIMRILARIDQMENHTMQKTLLSVSASLRLTAAFICILLCSLSHNAFFTLTVLAAELTRAAFMSAEALSRIMKKVCAAVLFMFMITLPAVFMGHPASALTIAMKVSATVMVLSVLNEIVSWKDMTGSFTSLHMPGLFVLVLDSTIRFLVILGRYSNALLEAVVCRSVGDTSWKDSHIGGILGTTWLKSQQMSQMTYEAMQCRCFDGTYKTYEKHQWGMQDLIYLAGMVLMILYYVYMEML